MDESRIVKITNIADFDFTPEMGAMYGGVYYPLSAGETKLMPYILGKHLARALARQIVIRKAPVAGSMEDRSAQGLFTDDAIQPLMNKILTDAYVEEKAPVKTPEQVLADKVQTLNSETANTTAPQDYKDKGEVIAELTKRGIAFDARKNKSSLEELLK